jgi:hypothetical protein
MADFALWVAACEPALWSPGTFWAAYCGNRNEAVESVIDADAIAASVRMLMGSRSAWTGTASDLLAELGAVADERVAKSKSWPDSPKALAGRLRRAATFLRNVGIEITFERDKGRARTRTINITNTAFCGSENHGKQSSVSSALEHGVARKFEAERNKTMGPVAENDDHGSDPNADTGPLKSIERIVADGSDANIPSQSESKNPEALD